MAGGSFPKNSVSAMAASTSPAPSSAGAASSAGISSASGRAAPALFHLPLIAICVVVLTVLFALVRPPSVEEVERDIWEGWTRRGAIDAQQLTLTDLVLREEFEGVESLLVALANEVHRSEARSVLPTQLRWIRVLDQKGAEIAQWSWHQQGTLAHEFGDDYGENWRTQRIALIDPTAGKVGELEVCYQFYVGGLDDLPNIARLRQQYAMVFTLVLVVAGVILIAVVANLLRLRERAGRLQSQQMTLELARQMCHELRNGLWAFAHEGKNLVQVFSTLERFTSVLPMALAHTAERMKLSAGDRERLEYAFNKYLRDHHVDPRADLANQLKVAREANARIETFASYLHLTVEELDRNLLGEDHVWGLQPLRLSETWRDACELLTARFAEANARHQEYMETENDWVFADRRALVQVFVNLAKNALEAQRGVPDPSALTFTLRGEGSTVHAEVHNSGPPIHPDHLPRIFDRGFSTKGGAQRGTGLALVRESIQRLGGTIVATSSADAGTSFRITLPLMTSPPRASTPSSVPSDLNSGTRT